MSIILLIIQIKYGLYAVRKFFQDIIWTLSNNNNYQINDNKDKNEDPKDDMYINMNGENKIALVKIEKVDNKQLCNDYLEVFLENDIINILFEIIKNNLNINEKQNYSNIFECFWIFINMSAINIKKDNYREKFCSSFVENDNLLALLSLINPQKYPQEIIHNVLILLGNIIFEYPCIINILINSSLTNICFDYLKKIENVNPEITLKILRLLYFLYNYSNIKLDIETYKTLFNVFSLFLKNFDYKEITNYCLETLSMLSSQGNKESIECFNDLDLMSALNNIIVTKPIKNNEIIINHILDIFCNIIEKGNENINKNIIEPGMLTIFYNNILRKYKEENIVIDNKVEENIIISVNNLIYYCHENNIKYIFGEGKEILDFFLKSAKGPYPRMKYFGIKSFVNILLNIEIDINLEIMNEILNSVIQALVNDYLGCYYVCCQCLQLIIENSKKRKLDNNILLFPYSKIILNFYYLKSFTYQKNIEP